ncbi:MAG: FemAB family XrtA/PEP-CTERM system-associated protein, partial [Longimicrobiales bacterium]
MSQIEFFSGGAGEWDAFVAGRPDASVAHLYGWRRVVQRVYGHDCPYLATREGQNITGVLPLVDVRSLAFGRFLVSMPYLSAGGPIGDAAALPALSEAAQSL